MSALPSPADLLSVAEASPRAVAAHDRAAWLALFGSDAEVCDPVGSRPRRGARELAAFHDAFIAPNTIRFDVRHDEVWPRPGGGTVFRDVDLSTTLPGGPTLTTVMHARYDLATDTAAEAGATGTADAGGGLRIERLRAHWQAPAMALGLLAAGPTALVPGLRMGAGLLRNLGPAGTAGFVRGFLDRPAALHRGRVVGMLRDACAGRPERDLAVVTWRIGPDAPTDADPGEVAALVRGARVTRVVAAGDTVSASLERPAGRGIALVEGLGLRGARAPLRVTLFASGLGASED